MKNNRLFYWNSTFIFPLQKQNVDFLIIIEVEILE